MGLADEIIRELGDDAHEGLRAAAHAVLLEAQRNVPVGDPLEDPNPAIALRESGEVEERTYAFRVSFDTPYAAKQHEALRFDHPRGGQAKYLEHALTTIVPALEGIVAGRVKRGRL